ncbi:MAG: hypothetical protein GY838_19465 [bacterium]|nr:hypothetical protein [bacterium]
MKNLILILTLAVMAAGCGDQVEQEAVAGAESAPAAETAHAAPVAQADVWRGKVAETMDAGKYTYVLLDTDGEQRWVAGPLIAVAVGDAVMMAPGMAMHGFKSETLDRTFEVVYFVAAIEKDDGHGHMPGASPHGAPAAEDPAAAMGGGASQHMNPGNAQVEGVEKAAGGVTVAEIHERADDLAGEAVKVRGRVVKFTPNIMGANWVHLQDGTGAAGSNDLTVTTSATVAVGDLVVVEGTLTKDKDFGAGYRYAVIIEGADVTKE